ncbi:binder of sperm protein homolog 2-like [Microtus ochrogaster]|uniref:Binder of sperm protein homolog 2-like n=1 Tax=Microtus ochrogaster TaxID=79684 RepID=A0ABM1AZ11_MICOH|nr:binder of sperm protein homolog 2-like [Microtus ochrogaster]
MMGIAACGRSKYLYENFLVPQGNVSREKRGRQLEVMRHLVGWLLLAVYMYGLNADLVPYLHPPEEEFPAQNCTFPFIYNEVVYHSCISVHSDFDWCSLDYYFQGRWRYCKAFDPPICIFPFQFGKKSINECTKQGYILNRSWCSLTDNYNRDRKWKQCSPYND